MDPKGHSFLSLLCKQIEYIETVPFKLIRLPPMSLRNNNVSREYKQAAPSWKEVNRFAAKYA
jgi:hypothetical protein